MRNSGQALMSRRRFLQLSGTLAVAPLFPATQSARAGMWSQLFGSTKRTTSPITSNDEFYITSYRTPPFVPADRWALTIRGTVISPFTLTYRDLLAQPAITEIVTLECVGNGVAGEAIGTAEWQGVRLKARLDKARVTSHTQNVVFHAADGYSDSLTIERAMMDDIMVAYRMNGVPLPLGHGFPARMIVPGHYGMKHVQWLTGIELVSSDYKGYYQRKDWSDEAIVKTSPGSWTRKPEIRYPLERSSSCRALPLRDPGGFVGWTSAPTEGNPGQPRPWPRHFLPTHGSYGVIHGNRKDLGTSTFWLERPMEQGNNNLRKKICHFPTERRDCK
ncbi:MAG: molybdopterin-dependent oxidoreductase, partial [Nitrospirales bacterium]